MRCALTCVAVVGICGTLWAAEKPEQSVRLFDGKSFQGWEGNLQVFRIQVQ